MAALGELTDGIARESGNPLDFVNNSADLSLELLGELKETAAPAIEGLREDRRGELMRSSKCLPATLQRSPSTAPRGRHRQEHFGAFVRHQR
jgi:hypothetical protein